MRFLMSVAAAVLGASMAINAQSSTTTTTTKTEDGKMKTVTYTGCLQTGTETQTWMLNKVVPVTTETTRPTATGGTITTSETSYVLVPGEKVTLQEHVGHKVQVVGMLVPEGESKAKTTTKIEREGEPDMKMKEKSKVDSDHPRLRVISVKELSEPCSN